MERSANTPSEREKQLRAAWKRQLYLVSRKGGQQDYAGLIRGGKQDVLTLARIRTLLNHEQAKTDTHE